METFLFRTCSFLLLFGVVTIAGNPVSSDPFSFVPSVFVQKPPEEEFSDTLKACSDLWTSNTADFHASTKSGFLGSREEVLDLCQPSDTAPICQTTLGLVSFICNSIKGKQYNKVESEVNKTAREICLAFRKETLVSKLGEVASRSMDPTRHFNNNMTSYAKSANFTECEEVCDSNLRLCQIILQTLETIVSEIRPNLEDKQLTEPQKTTTKLEVIVSLSSTTAKTPSTAPASPSNTADNKPLKSSINVLKNSEDKPVVQTTVKNTENKDWKPISPDAAEEDGFEEMEKPYPSDDDLDLADKDIEAIGNNKLNNDAFVGTPTKPSQSYDSESEIDEDPVNTHFIFYFLAAVPISVCGYLLYQRRNRIFALVLEGPGGQARRRSRSSRSRASTGSYHKLVNNLEEAITSHSVKNSNVVY